LLALLQISMHKHVDFYFLEVLHTN
jgi:hypothetical protein